MGECKLDHTAEDVKAKFESQQEFLPAEITMLFAVFFEQEHSQAELNKVFHLLKKYDFATEEDKKVRDQQLSELLRKA